MEKCFNCERWIVADFELDQCIYFGAGDNEIICRDCFEKREMRNLSEEQLADVYIEESMNTEDRFQRYVLLQEALKILPTATIFSELGNLTQSPVEAEFYFRKALDLSEKNLTAIGNLPLVLAAQNRFDEALSFVDKYASYPDIWDIHFLRAKLLTANGKTDEASLELQSAMKNPCGECRTSYLKEWSKGPNNFIWWSDH